MNRPQPAAQLPPAGRLFTSRCFRNVSIFLVLRSTETLIMLEGSVAAVLLVGC